MDQERQRIQDDLRGLVKGDVRCDDVFVQLYASDASVYQIRPLGVVRPRNTADVVACVQYAAEKRIPVHARGAGTGLAGESLGPGLVLDFSRYMRRILRVDADRVRVQPGVVHGQLNQHLRTIGTIVWPRSGDEPGDHDGKRRRDRRFGKSLAAIRLGPPARAQLAGRPRGRHVARGRPRAAGAGTSRYADDAPSRAGGQLADLFARHTRSSANVSPRRCSTNAAINWATCSRRTRSTWAACWPAAKARWP